jgi:DNA-binding MarR family transcriptional regulator/ribosomal protein S18 acetylase RimI-like enzyme
VLYELAHDAAPARVLAARLGLDEGYLSRVLGRFERKGWIERIPENADARRRALSLTPGGAEMMSGLERRSRAAIAERFAKLGTEARVRLRDGMSAVRNALASEAGQGFTFRRLATGDGGWVVQRHGEIYARDEGYDARFEGLVAEIVGRFLAGHDPLREAGWVALDQGVRVGSIFVVREDERTARLRLVLIEPGWRGRGLGRRMLDHALDFARDAGYLRIVLWTHESHRAACRLYAAAGFRMTSSEPAEAFGVAVVDQTWELDL